MDARKNRRKDGPRPTLEPIERRLLLHAGHEHPLGEIHETPAEIETPMTPEVAEAGPVDEEAIPLMATTSTPRPGRISARAETIYGVVAPQVTRVQRLGSHHQATRFVLTFSQPMRAGAARNTGSYTLNAPGDDGQFGTPDDVNLPLRRPLQDATGRIVTIRPNLRIDLHQVVRLKVNGSLAGLSSTDGILLDGDADGQPGGNFVTVIQGFGPRAIRRPRS